MEFDFNATEYIKKRDGISGISSQNKPYISFCYPKTDEQIKQEQDKLYKDGKQKEAKNVKPYINGLITLDQKDKFVLIDEYDDFYKKQRFRFQARPDDNTLSMNGVKKYAQTNQTCSCRDLHKRIVEEIKKYCFLKEDETYDIIAIYIMLTYKFKFLDFMPILHLNGEAGTGKSQIGKICTKLGFNSTSTVSTTSSSFFRRIDRKRGLYFMDEKEKLEDYEKELLNGCTYEGNVHTVTEKVNDQFIDTDFHIYTPVILACINEVYGATSTRTIKIETVKPPRNFKKYPVIRLTENKPEWEELRDDLCAWSIKTYKENQNLMIVDKEIEKILNNRAVDTWKSVLNQAKLNGVYDKLIRYIDLYYIEQIEEMSENDLNFGFIKYIASLGDHDWITAESIFEEFSRNFLTEKTREFFNQTRAGRLLRRMGYDKRSELKKRRGDGFVYKLSFKKSMDFIRNNYEFTNDIDEKLEEIIVTEETIIIDKKVKEKVRDYGADFCEVATCLFCKETKTDVRLKDMKCLECVTILEAKK